MSDREPLYRRLLGRRRREPTAFITGDASGSVIENVHTGADSFIVGDQTGAVIRNVVHTGSEPPDPRHERDVGEQQDDGGQHEGDPA
jgi:hypothetical protein